MYVTNEVGALEQVFNLHSLLSQKQSYPSKFLTQLLYIVAALH